jgi:putative ABC transport system ATP-binding protein
MTITLDHLVPFPLRERVLEKGSEIWNRHWSISAPQFIKVKAPSGSGKTTLVHTIWNLRGDYKGHVLYDGKPLAALNAETLAQYRQRQLSVVFQDLRLFGQLSARENLELKRTLIPNTEAASSEIDRMAERLGVAHILDQPAYKCSYGEQQRIAIIRALLQPFQLLLMDEPFSHLDQANASKAASLIAEECRKQNAGLLITDLDEDKLFDYHHFYAL